MRMGSCIFFWFLYCYLFIFAYPNAHLIRVQGQSSGWPRVVRGLRALLKGAIMVVWTLVLVPLHLKVHFYLSVLWVDNTTMNNISTKTNI